MKKNLTQASAQDGTLAQDDNVTIERILLSRQTELTEKANGVCFNIFVYCI